jgi:hypothetical protein
MGTVDDALDNAMCERARETEWAGAAGSSVNRDGL